MITSRPAEGVDTTVIVRAASVVRAMALLSVAGVAVLWLSSLAATAPLHVVALTAALGVLAAVRPTNALLIIAALVPWSGALTGLLHVPIAWTEPLILTGLAGWLTGAALRRRPVLPPAPTRVPWLLSVVVVSASLAVELAVLQLFFANFGRELFEVLGRGYFVNAAGFPAVAAAVRDVEALLLFAWTMQAAGTPVNRLALARMLALGIAGVAALNVNRFAEILIRQPAPFSALADLAMRLRINASFGELNAAGSILAMVIPIAAAAFQDRRARIARIAMVALACAGLWLTGSRTAILVVLALSLVLLAKGALQRGRGRTARSLAITVLLAVVVAAGTIVVRYPDRLSGVPAAEALKVRFGMARTAIRMAASKPVFGVGIGAFYARSSEFMPPEVAGMYVRENAHNNFLQILAETGGVGLAAFLWLIAASFVSVRGTSSDPERRLLIGLRTGAAIFLVTGLTGHPLLVREAAVPFWIVLGLIAARPRMRADIAGDPVPASGRTRWVRWSARTAVLALALSVWPRARQQRSEADLEHVAFGMSPWRKTDAGEFLRDVGRHATFFVPADAPMLEVPFRLTSSSNGSAVVHVFWQRREADALALPDAKWHMLRMIVPRVQGARFRRIDLTLETSGDVAVVMGRPAYPGWTPSTR